MNQNKLFNVILLNKTFFFLLLLVSVFIITPQSNTQPTNHSIFVSTTWLSDHLDDSSLVILHVAPIRREYANGHIQGARFLWPGWMVLSNPELSYEVLSVEHLDTLLEGLGVSNDSRIILCGSGGNLSAVARMYVTLDYLGLGDKTSILDGGIDAWKSEGRQVIKKIPSIKRSSFTPHLKKDVFVDTEFVKSNLNKPNISIIDVRPPNVYKGTTSTGYTRSGHIPGAVNINYTSFTDSTNKILPSAKLSELFKTAGINEGSEVIPYCNIGASASIAYVVARYLGYNARLYDGSFEEWSGREELPIEIPAKPDSIKK